MLRMTTEEFQKEVRKSIHESKVIFDALNKI